MPRHASRDVNSVLAHLEEEEKVLLERAAALMKAYDGALYPLDFYAHAATNRSLALAAGFRSLIGDRNLICAGAIVRMQLDTAMRFFAAFIVDKPHDFAMDVFRGAHVRKLRDKAGNLMTDHYLITQLSGDYPWIAELYEYTSSYIHLSDTHIQSTIDGVSHKDEGEHSLQIKIGWQDKELPDSIYIDAVQAFRRSLEIFTRYLNGWIFTKDNPEVVAQQREEHENQ